MFQPSNKKKTFGDTMLVQILLNWPSQFARLVTASHRKLTALNTMLAKENVLVLCVECVLEVIQKQSGQRTVHQSRTAMTTGFGYCL